MPLLMKFENGIANWPGSATQTFLPRVTRTASAKSLRHIISSSRISREVGNHPRPLASRTPLNNSNDNIAPVSRKRKNDSVKKPLPPNLKCTIATNGLYIKSCGSTTGTNTCVWVCRHSFWVCGRRIIGCPSLDGFEWRTCLAWRPRSGR